MGLMLDKDELVKFPAKIKDRLRVPSSGTPCSQRPAFLRSMKEILAHLQPRISSSTDPWSQRASKPLCPFPFSSRCGLEGA